MGSKDIVLHFTGEYYGCQINALRN